MARNDGIDRTVARNQDLETPEDVAKIQEHNEREKDSYSNQDIVPERSALNVHYKAPTDDYVKMFHLLEHFYIIVRGCFEMNVQRCTLWYDVLIAVTVLFTLIMFMYLRHICRGFQVLISGYGTVYSIISCHRFFVLSLGFADSGELRRGTFSKCNNPL